MNAIQLPLPWPLPQGEGDSTHGYGLLQVASPAAGQQVIHRTGSKVPRRRFARHERTEVRLPTFDLGVFSDAKIAAKQAALRFHHEIQVLALVLLNQYGPIRVVIAKRSWNREPSGKLGIHSDSIVIFELIRKTGLRYLIRKRPVRRPIFPCRTCSSDNQTVIPSRRVPAHNNDRP